MSAWVLVVLLWHPEGRLDVAAYPFKSRYACEGAKGGAAAHFGEAYLAARCEYQART